MLIRSGSVLIDMRSLTKRAMRDRPTENWLAMSSPTVRTRRFPRWSISSVEPRPLAQLDEVTEDLDKIFLGEDRLMRRDLQSPGAY